jgi:hypothetical protein
LIAHPAKKRFINLKSNKTPGQIAHLTK